MKTPPPHQAAQRARQQRARQRQETLQLTISRETKALAREIATRNLMSLSEFFEWIVWRYSKGLVVVLEEGAFVEAMLKAVEQRAAEKGAEAGETACLQVLYDHGLRDSPYR